MDAHFDEYLAAVTGMQELYGVRDDGHPTEFHDDGAAAGVADHADETVGSHWDV